MYAQLINIRSRYCKKVNHPTSSVDKNNRMSKSRNDISENLNKSIIIADDCLSNKTVVQLL